MLTARLSSQFKKNFSIKKEVPGEPREADPPDKLSRCLYCLDRIMLHRIFAEQSQSQEQAFHDA